MTNKPIIIDNPSPQTMKIMDTLKKYKGELLEQMRQQRDLAIDITK